MLKEVGASGQISLGKRFAKQLFEVVYHDDGRVELLPMRAVRLTPSAPPVLVNPADGWRPPGGYEQCTRWAVDNRQALDTYAARIDADGTAADQMRAFLEAQPSAGPD